MRVLLRCQREKRSFPGGKDGVGGFWLWISKIVLLTFAGLSWFS
jgi:hypothetical protein